MDKVSIRKMITLIWPIFIELLLQMLVSNADQIMVANYRQTAVGAISNANQILNIVMLVFSMISMATSILIAQYKGAGQPDKVSQITTLSCVVNTILSLLLGIVMIIFCEQFFVWLQVPAEFMEDAMAYTVITGGCCFLQALFMTFTAVFRSHQMMKINMFSSILMNLVNVAGNALLINGFGPIAGMGVRGAAWATVSSRLIGLLVLIWCYRRHLHGHFRLSHIRPFPTDLFKKLVRIGIPAGGESFSYNIVQLVTLAMINSFGAEATIARSHCGVVSSIALLYCLSVAQAAQVVVGYQVGASDYKGAHSTVRFSVLSSIGITSLFSILIYLLYRPIFSLLGAEGQVLSLCCSLMFIEIFRQFGRSFNMLYIRALQGAGDIRFPISIGIISMWVIIAGVGYLLGCFFDLGIIGIWIAYTLDENLRGIIFFVRWKSEKWKAKRLVD